MKTKLLISLALVAGLMATAWGQARLNFYSGQTVARQGGKAELAGSVYLYTQDDIEANEAVTLTLRYGAPVVNEMGAGITVRKGD